MNHLKPYHKTGILLFLIRWPKKEEIAPKKSKKKTKNKKPTHLHQDKLETDEQPSVTLQHYCCNPCNTVSWFIWSAYSRS